MYQSAAALWLKLQSAVAELRRHQLAAIMPGGFDIAMEHICRYPFLDFADYGFLASTSGFGSFTVSHGTAVAELRRLQAAAIMRCGFETAMAHICRYPFFHVVDYCSLAATSRFGAVKVLIEFN